MNSWLNLVSMTMDLLLTVYSSGHSGVVMKLWPGQQQVLWSVQRRWWILEAHRSRIHSCFINRNCRQYAHVGFWGSMCWYLYPALHVRPTYKTWYSKRKIMWRMWSRSESPDTYEVPWRKEAWRMEVNLDYFTGLWRMWMGNWSEDWSGYT